MAQITLVPVLPEIPRVYIYAAGIFGVKNYRKTPFSGVSVIFGEADHEPR